MSASTGTGGEIAHALKDPIAFIHESKGLGLMLALAGNTIIPVGLSVQKWAHTEYSSVHYLKVPYWWLGFALMIFGEIGNFTAYSFAPAVLVAPLGGVSVLVNAVIAWYFLNESFRKQDYIGYILAIVGGFIIVYFAPDSADEFTIEMFKDYLRSGQFVIYFCCLAALSFGLIYISAYTSHGHQYVLVDVMVCSTVGSMTVMAIKGLSTFIRMTVQHKEDAFTDWLTYVLIFVVIFTAVAQMNFLQKAIKNFGTKEVIPVFYVMFTLWSIMGGIVLYRELNNMAVTTNILFMVGVLTTFGGVYLLTSNRRDEDSAEVKASKAASQHENAKYEGLLLGGIGGLGVGLVLFSFSLPVLAFCSLGFGMIGLGTIFYKDLEAKHAMTPSTEEIDFATMSTASSIASTDETKTESSRLLPK